jgi:hypothetical protein
MWKATDPEKEAGKELMKITRTNWVQYKDHLSSVALSFGHEFSTMYHSHAELADYTDAPRREQYADPKDYREATRKYTEHMDKKSKFLGTHLLQPCDPVIKDKIISKRKAEYHQAVANLELIKILDWFEDAMGGTGSVSAASLFQDAFELDQRKPDEHGKMRSNATMARVMHELRTRIKSLGTADEVLDMLFDVKWILCLDPSVASNRQLIDENMKLTKFKTFEANSEAACIAEDNVDRNKGSGPAAKEEGVTEAYAAGGKGKDKGRSETPTKPCDNCGGNHFKKQCPKPPRKCNFCGKSNHMMEFCHEKARQEKAAKAATSQKSNKSQKNAFDLEALARKAKTGDATQEEIGDGIAFLLSKVEDDSEDKLDSEGEQWTLVEGKQARRKRKDPTGADSRIHVDSACTHRHIVTDGSPLRNKHVSNIRVGGISGPAMATQHEGTLPGVPGKFVSLPQAKANLLSLMELIKPGGRFYGDTDAIRIYDKDGVPLLTAPAHDGGWSVPLSYILDRADEKDAAVVMAHLTSVDTSAETATVKLRKINGLKTQLQLTAEEINRADEAGILHFRLGHPSKVILIKTVESGTLGNTNVTARDVENWYELRGPCSVCTEAKIRRAPAPPRQRELPTKIGQELHGDLVPLAAETVGGNRQALVTSDRRSRHMETQLMKDKLARTVAEAWRRIIASYNQHGHRVDGIVSDHEPTLNAAGGLLKDLGVTHQTAPAGRASKFIERQIQMLKNIKKSIRAQHRWEIPPELDGDLTMEATHRMNDMVRSVSSKSSTEMVKGRKARVPKHLFGTVGVYEKRGNKAGAMPGKWGMYVGSSKGSDENNLRVYNFELGTIVSCNTFKPHDNPPMAMLGLKPRLKIEGKRGSGVTVKEEPGTSLLGSIPTQTPNINVQTGRRQELQPTTPARDLPRGTVSPSSPPGLTQNGPDPEGLMETSTPHHPVAPPVQQTAPRDDWRNDSITEFSERLARNMEELERSGVLGQRPAPPIPSLDSIRQQLPQANAAESHETADDTLPGLIAHNDDDDDDSDAGDDDTDANPTEGVTGVVAEPKESGTTQQTQVEAEDTEVTEAEREEAEQILDSEEFEEVMREAYSTAHQTRKLLAERRADDDYRFYKWLTRERGEAAEVQSYAARQHEAEEGAQRFIQAMRMSYREAVNNAGDKKLIDDALQAEVKDNILPCGYAVDIRSISKEARRGILNSFVFMKDKWKSNGVFDRWKARLVCNGSQQCIEKVGDTFAPTVNTISVNLILQALADAHEFERRRLASWDIAGAFITTKIPRGVEPIYVKLPKEIAAIWINERKDDKKFLLTDGCLVIRLTHYLYGLRESPERFQTKLKNLFIANGLVQSKADPCVFSLTLNGKTSHIATWVDDILGSLTEGALEYMRHVLKVKGGFKIAEQLDNVSYLGMQIRHNKRTGDVGVHQKGMIDKLLARYTTDKTREYDTPSASDLGDRNPDSRPLDNTKNFRSPCMALMYLARLTRPDILNPVSVLATRTATPTEEDRGKLDRVFGYLKKTRTVGLRFRKGDRQLRVYADASHGFHPDGSGQGGIIITYGSAPIYSKSWKIRIITRSSSETELVCLEEASTFPVWINRLIKDLKLDTAGPARLVVKIGAPVIYQDNKSTMLLAKNGGSFQRTKHLMIKESFVRQGIKQKDFRICYLPTKAMLADWHTKPHGKAVHYKFMKELHMVNMPEPTAGNG